jgi:hypothetical protein
LEKNEGVLNSISSKAKITYLGTVAAEVLQRNALRHVDQNLKLLCSPVLSDVVPTEVNHEIGRERSEPGRLLGLQRRRARISEGCETSM